MQNSLLELDRKYNGNISLLGWWVGNIRGTLLNVQTQKDFCMQGFCSSAIWYIYIYILLNHEVELYRGSDYLAMDLKIWFRGQMSIVGTLIYL